MGTAWRGVISIQKKEEQREVGGSREKKWEASNGKRV